MKGNVITGFAGFES